jgi:hypothetical protein
MFVIEFGDKFVIHSAPEGVIFESSVGCCEHFNGYQLLILGHAAQLFRAFSFHSGDQGLVRFYFATSKSPGVRIF